MLSSQQRRARAFSLKRNKSKLTRGARIARLRKYVPTDKLKARALRAAKRIVTKTLTGGKSKSKLSYAARSAIEKSLKFRVGQINALAASLLPKIRNKAL